MKVISTERKLCLCCMEEHDVQTVVMNEKLALDDIDVEYEATYFYCERTDELFVDEDMLSDNHIAMKQALVRQQTELKAWKEQL